MIDDSLLWFLAGFAIGSFLAWRITNRFHMNMISEIFARAGVTPEKLESVVEELSKEINGDDNGPRIEVTIETHSGHLYAFRKDTNEFLAQGADRETLLKVIAEKLKDCVLVIKEEDGAALIKDPTT